MEPYWSQEYNLKIGDVEKHLVKLYQYSERSVCLISTPSFGKSFSKNFKSVDGRFNNNLKINDEKVPGWIFKFNEENLEKLNDILKDIYEGNIKPGFNIIKPDFDLKSKNNRVFNLISQLVKLIPEDTEEYILSEEEGVKTTIYYNRDEETVTEGDMVYSFNSGKKSLEIYQLVDRET